MIAYGGYVLETVLRTDVCVLRLCMLGIVPVTQRVQYL